MVNILYFHFHFLFLLLILILFQTTPTLETSITNSSNNRGFTVQLIHKTNTPISSSSSLFFASKSAFTKVTSNNGDYLMKLTLGTPPLELYGLADTGSDLIWAQCAPCENCYKQKRPMFDPTKSSTYSEIPCGSEQCGLLYGSSCSEKRNNNVCEYTYAYADSSVSKGVLARERIRLQGEDNIEGAENEIEIVFGCGHSNSGNMNENDMGIIGLGGGPLSLVSQVGALYGGRKFSQCLVPFRTHPNISGILKFGEGSEVCGEGVVTTPLVSQDGQTSYMVTLKGISVGDTFIPFNNNINNNNTSYPQGNIMIDSGTPATYLPQEFYESLVQELKGQSNMIPIEDDPDLGTQLCYKSDTNNFEPPILTAHFDNDADLPLMPTQTFIPPKDGVYCFAMAGSDDGDFIFGNFAQSNVLIGFDLDQKIVSFKPTDCTNL